MLKKIYTVELCVDEKILMSCEANRMYAHQTILINNIALTLSQWTIVLSRRQKISIASSCEGGLSQHLLLRSGDCVC